MVVSYVIASEMALMLAELNGAVTTFMLKYNYTGLISALGTYPG